jgi:hypothetical protein
MLNLMAETVNAKYKKVKVKSASLNLRSFQSYCIGKLNVMLNGVSASIGNTCAFEERLNVLSRNRLNNSQTIMY